jgi:putative transposase
LAAKELVRLAAEQGLSLTGPDGLLKQFIKTVLETALNEEMTGHLGHEKNQAEPDRGSSNVRNGSRAKTVLTEATGHVEIDVPRDRDGTFEPAIAKKHQRRLTGVDEMVLSLYAHGLTTGEIPPPGASGGGAPVRTSRRFMGCRFPRRRSRGSPTRCPRKWRPGPTGRSTACIAAIFIDAIVVKIRDGQVATPRVGTPPVGPGPSMRRSVSPWRVRKTSSVCGRGPEVRGRSSG